MELSVEKKERKSKTYSTEYQRLNNMKDQNHTSS